MSPDFDSGLENPSCGDKIAVTGMIRDGVLTEVAFQGEGCVISQAAASLLLEYAVGKSVVQIRQFDAQFMQELIGILLGPTRLRCALLPLEALQKGVVGEQ